MSSGLIDGFNMDGHLHHRTVQSIGLAVIAGFVVGRMSAYGGWLDLILGILVGAVFVVLADARMPDAETVAIQWRKHQRITEGEGR